MYLSWERREEISACEVTSWIAVCGIEVFWRAAEMVLEMERKVEVVSLPPGGWEGEVSLCRWGRIGVADGVKGG